MGGMLGGLMFTLKTKWVAVTAYITLALGPVIFFLGWLRLFIGIPAALVLVAGLVWLLRKDYGRDDSSIQVPIVHLVLQIALIAFVVGASGIAGVGVSGYDTAYRNAIFTDIVEYGWPVIYDDGSAMVYYCVFWMLPALFGKLFGLSAGYVALGVFATWIVVLAHLLILTLLKLETPGKTWASALFLMGWSGLHLIGAAVATVLGWNLYDYGILTDGGAYCDLFYNGEAFNWYYRSNFITLSEPYNQIALWLVMPLMMLKRTPRSYICLGLLLLPYSPWCFLGVVPLMIAAAWPYMADLVKQGKVMQLVKEILSPANIAALVTIVPVFALYFLASSRMGGAASVGIITPDQVDEYVAAGLPYTTQTGSFGILSLDRFGWKNVLMLILFWVIEFGVFMFLIAPKYRRHNPLYWVVLVMLMVSPLIWFGTIGGRDFCMNGSLPALFVLMIWTLEYACEEVAGKPLGMRSLCLIIALTIAFGGTVLGFSGRLAAMKEQHSIAIINNSIGSLANLDYEYKSNFVILEPEGTVFFDHLAR